MSALAARSVSFHVGKRPIVDGVDLEVRPGELLALVGPNGAGKSTLLRLLAGELEPTSGAVVFGETALASLGASEQARLRAVMPQHTSVQFAFTVRQIAELGRYPHRPSRADGAIVDGALETAGVAHVAGRSVPTLSGGEQALTTLARVVAQEAGVLLLDEPTASLDIRHREHVLTIARETAEQGGAVCVVVHDLNIAAAYADRIAVLHEGRKACDSEPWQALTEDRLARVFGHPVCVTRSPVGDHPLVTPLPGTCAGRCSRGTAQLALIPALR
jgi:iron complex transport system ATP-binding protein